MPMIWVLVDDGRIDDITSLAIDEFCQTEGDYTYSCVSSGCGSLYQMDQAAQAIFGYTQKHHDYVIVLADIDLDGSALVIRYLETKLVGSVVACSGSGVYIHRASNVRSSCGRIDFVEFSGDEQRMINAFVAADAVANIVWSTLGLALHQQTMPDPYIPGIDLEVFRFQLSHFGICFNGREDSYSGDMISIIQRTYDKIAGIYDPTMDRVDDCQPVGMMFHNDWLPSDRRTVLNDLEGSVRKTVELVNSLGVVRD